jgi:glycosyltransferase involved in cell wall biosynthesis
MSSSASTQRSQDPVADSSPTFAIVVPAYNEAHNLPHTLPNLTAAIAAAPLPGELIVVDNNSSDDTAEVARKLGARVVFEPVNQISRARNAGARASTSDYLVFVDADTRPPQETIHSALSALCSGEVCGGGALVTFDCHPGASVRFLIAFWNTMAPRMGWAAGCFVYCTREAFDAVGGFSERVFASEELWFSRDLRRFAKSRQSGRQRFEVIREPRVLTSSRKLDQPLRMWRSLLVLIFFPWGVRYRWLCPWWYKRSGKE